MTGLFIETVSIYQVSPSVAPSGGTDRELNADSRLRTFLYPTISNSFMCSSALMLKSRSHTVVQKRDEQIKNKKHRTFHPSGIRRSPSHAKLGMVIEVVHTIFAPQTFWERSYSLSLRAQKIGVNVPTPTSNPIMPDALERVPKFQQLNGHVSAPNSRNDYASVGRL